MNQSNKISAIVLAAGLSMRMGECKQLLKLYDKPMLELILDKLVQIPFHEIILVSRNEVVYSLKKYCGIKFVENKHPYLGISSSLHAGVNAASGDGYMFFTADQPLLSVQSIMQMFQKSKSSKILIAKHGKITGNPVFFSSKYKDELLATVGDTGGKSVYKNNIEECQYCNLISELELMDIDTKDEYNTLQASSEAKEFYTQYLSDMGRSSWKPLLPQFNLSSKEFITIIGAGGKTSLMYQLSSFFSKKSSVLIGTTTRIILPPKDKFTYTFNPTEMESCSHIAVSKLGVSLTGCIKSANNENSNIYPSDFKNIPYDHVDPPKIGHPKNSTLKKAVQKFDYVILEGDGSKTLPLKGWSTHEPVIPDETTYTIALLPLWTLGKPISESIIHRMDSFCAITGAKQGDILTIEHLFRYICKIPSSAKNDQLSPTLSDEGLLYKCKGKILLLFNQIKSFNQIDQAKELASLVVNDLKRQNSIRLEAIIAAEVQINQGITLWKK